MAVSDGCDNDTGSSPLPVLVPLVNKRGGRPLPTSYDARNGRSKWFEHRSYLSPKRPGLGAAATCGRVLGNPRRSEKVKPVAPDRRRIAAVIGVTLSA